MNCFKYHIKNVWIVPGNGSGPVKQELLIGENGKILAAGSSFTGCGKIIDGKRKLLSPGFIDAHGHSDMSVFAYPGGFSKISQGVTTEIAGNCGLSAFPLTGKNREHLEELYANYQVEFSWSDFVSYRRKLAEVKAVPDVIPLCGHNTLRAAVAGYEKTVLSGSEMNTMQELLAEALDSGSPGLSAGLLYVPGKFASDGELIGLMKVLAAKDKIFTTHLRSEGDGLLESLDEIFSLAEAAGLKKIQISHFKTAGKANWHKLDEALERIMQARAGGIRVTIDRYPYTESMTQLSVILPGEWGDMDDVSIMKKLHDPEERRELIKLLKTEKTPDYWQRVRLASTGSAKYLRHCGKKFTEISDFPEELAADLLSEDAPGTCGAFSGMSEDNLRRIIKLDFCMPGSDGYALPGDGSAGRTHPRSFGTVPRFLRMLLEDNVPVGSAVNRATGLPASVFGLGDRGLIEPGRRADLVLFDPDELTGSADFNTPDLPAEGIIWTMVNGDLIFHR